MKFYDRKKEIEILRRNWEKSAEHSLFTVMIGRRRIGKDASLAQDRARAEVFCLCLYSITPDYAAWLIKRRDFFN